MKQVGRETSLHKILSLLYFVGYTVVVQLMEIFQPSLFLAMFPYLFIGSFPLFGLILATKWIVNDTKKNRARYASPEPGNEPSIDYSDMQTNDIEIPKKFFI